METDINHLCLDFISEVETFGKNAVVCGRSKNVGMPIAMLLHADGAGMYVFYSNSRYLPAGSLGSRIYMF
jgi:5,10-methylene-tetrahydrofolate dehydrogenase/Methenyl tetrahydrofolate cyclohydrolase